MDVDQNKGIWGSYNRRSTANQSRSQRCQSRESSLVCNTDSAQRIVKTLLDITVFRDMAWARAYLGGFNNCGAIADQSRTNRGFHRHFLKIELILVVRLWVLFVLILLRYWLSRNITWLSCHIILISPLSIANQSPINRDAGFYNRGCSNTHALS